MPSFWDAQTQDREQQVAEAQVKLKDVAAEFGRRFKKVVPTDEPEATRIAIFEKADAGGRKWIEICNVFNDCISLTPDHAISQWLAAMEKYAADRTEALYWRIEPEIDRWDLYLRPDIEGRDGVIGSWRVYARLLIL